MEQTEFTAVVPDVALRDLGSDLWRDRYFAMSLIVFCTVAGGLIGHFLPRQFEASVFVMPVYDDSPENFSTDSTESGGFKGVISAFSGKATLSGLMGLGNNPAKDEAIAVLRSEVLSEQFIKDWNLLPVLFYRSWDAKLQRWKQSDPKSIPTLWKGYRYFSTRVRTVREDRSNGMIILTIKWRDAKLAASWANALVARANEYLRQRAIREARHNIAYLSEQADTTRDVEEKEAIYSLLEQEIGKAMLANERADYSLKVVDPAVAPERSSSPTTLALALIGLILGCGTSVLYTIFNSFRTAFRQPDKSQSPGQPSRHASTA